ncbi:thiolase family protein [Mycobacterium sp. NPDC003449]
MTVDALLIDAVRSPLCFDSGGSLSATAPMELARQTITALLRRTGIDTGDVDRVLVQFGDRAARDVERAGSLIWPVTSLPTRMPAVTIDRWCGTGQRAMHHAARSIVKGLNDIVVVVGVESSDHPDPVHRGAKNGHGGSRDYTVDGLSRGLAAEMLASVKHIVRDQLDEYTVRSHWRAAEVANAREFDREIAPVLIRGLRGEPDCIVTRDETINANLTFAQLKSMKPAFIDQDVAQRHPEISWSMTDGNCARHAVGASALLFMSPRRATHLAITPRARIHGFAIAQGTPRVPLDAPLRATELVLESTRMDVTRFDHIEVDEEFACVPLAWLDEFHVDTDLFNPRGGALGLGNPRACGGIRQVTTMLSALEATGGRYGLQAMGADAGGAYASVLERY